MENQRSQTIIKNHFQHRLILSTLLMTLITLNVIIMGALILEAVLGRQAGFVNILTMSVAAMEVIAVFIVYWVSRRISFHIAGPVYAIERTLKEMKSGNVSQRLQLRTGDHFVEVADAINDVLETYQERIGRIQSAFSKREELSAEQQQELEDLLAWFATAPEKEAS